MKKVYGQNMHLYDAKLIAEAGTRLYRAIVEEQCRELALKYGRRVRVYKVNSSHENNSEQGETGAAAQGGV